MYQVETGSFLFARAARDYAAEVKSSTQQV